MWLLWLCPVACMATHVIAASRSWRLPLAVAPHHIMGCCQYACSCLSGQLRLIEPWWLSTVQVEWSDFASIVAKPAADNVLGRM
jgi:hypothetical protein